MSYADPYGSGDLGYSDPYGTSAPYGAIAILATAGALAAKAAGAIGTGVFIARARGGYALQQAGKWAAANPEGASAAVQAGGGLLGILANLRGARREAQAQIGIDARQAGYNVAAQQYHQKLAALQAMQAEKARRAQVQTLSTLGMMTLVVVVLFVTAKSKRRRSKR